LEVAREKIKINSDRYLLHKLAGVI